MYVTFDLFDMKLSQIYGVVKTALKLHYWSQKLK